MKGILSSLNIENISLKILTIAILTVLSGYFFESKIILTLVAFFAASVANATAIGGGFLFMPLFIFVYKLAPAVALKRLTQNKGLDNELVKQFIACIGIYPVGSLVKLKSGKLGLVAKVNADDLLNPIIMTFYSIRGGHHTDIKRLDLRNIEDEIESSVKPSDFNINLPRFFKEVFVS